MNRKKSLYALKHHGQNLHAKIMHSEHLWLFRSENAPVLIYVGFSELQRKGAFGMHVKLTTSIEQIYFFKTQKLIIYIIYKIYNAEDTNYNSDCCFTLHSEIQNKVCSISNPFHPSVTLGSFTLGKCIFFLINA
jgi:hypothetical protein